MDQFSLRKHYTKILKIAIWLSLSKFLCDDLEIIVVKLSQMLPYTELGYLCNFLYTKKGSPYKFPYYFYYILFYFCFENVQRVTRETNISEGNGYCKMVKALSSQKCNLFYHDKTYKQRAWLRNFTLGQKIVVKGNFKQKAKNEGCFILFLRTKWRILHTFLEFVLFVFVEIALHEN